MDMLNFTCMYLHNLVNLLNFISISKYKVVVQCVALEMMEVMQLARWQEYCDFSLPIISVNDIPRRRQPINNTDTLKLVSS